MLFSDFSFIGFNNTNLYDEQSQRAIVNIEGTLELNGDFVIGAGSRLDIGPKGVLQIRSGVVANSAGLMICCYDFISIGGGTIISWDTTIIDKYFHNVIGANDGTIKDDHGPIFIGDRAWICMGSRILKGSSLPNGCILSAGSVLSKIFFFFYCLLRGNPASVIKSDLTWSDNDELLEK